MSFAFEPDESIPHAVRRVARRQLERAAASLSAERVTDQAVHDARRRLKRVRAVLRLVRPALGSKTFDHENRIFRDAGRVLSAVRDAAVLVAALDGLVRRARRSPRHRAFQSLRRALQARLRLAHERITPSELHDIANKLEKAIDRIKKWKGKSLTHDAVLAGLRRTYRDGRRAMQCAAKQPDPELFHEWRKRAKDLWHHAQLLANAWPPELEGFADRAHDLGDLLGDDHDLAVLRQTIADDAATLELPHADVTQLLEWIAARRAKLQQDAMALGSRLYRDKPKAFVARLAGSLQSDESK